MAGIHRKNWAALPGTALRKRRIPRRLCRSRKTGRIGWILTTSLREEEPEDPDATKIYRNFSNGYGAYNTDDTDPVDYADDTLYEEPQDLKGTDWGKVVLALVAMGLIGVGLAVAGGLLL